MAFAGAFLSRKAVVAFMLTRTSRMTVVAAGRGRIVTWIDVWPETFFHRLHWKI